MANITILPFSVLHTQRCQTLYAPNRTTSHNSHLQSNHIGNDEALIFPSDIFNSTCIILSINIIILMMLSASTINTAISYNHYRNKAIFIIISCLMSAMICSSQWIKVEDPLLPTADKFMIPAFYNDSIFIIGGMGDAGTVVSEYVISDNIMYDGGSIIAQDNIWCAGQCHTQFGNTLRFLVGKIYVYNLEEKNFVYPTDSIIIPDGVKYNSGNCLTSNDDYLFIIGGWGATVDKAVQVLILDTNTWFNGTSLTNSRVDHGCMATANVVYVFGSISTTSVDKIAINDIETGSWTHIGNLTDSLYSMGSALYNNLIWIIGGAVRNSNQSINIDEPQDYIHTINIIHDSVTLRTERLPYAVFGAATIIANDILYVFGGVISYNTDGGVKTNTWMKYYLIASITSTTTNPITSLFNDKSTTFEPHTTIKSTASDVTISNITIDAVTFVSTQSHTTNPSSQHETTNQMPSISISTQIDIAHESKNNVDKAVFVVIGSSVFGMLLLISCSLKWYKKHQKQAIQISYIKRAVSLSNGKKNKKMKKQAASKADGQNPKCIQCGDILTKGIKKINASFICATCNALDISVVDDDVDKMFDNGHNPKTKGNVESEGNKPENIVDEEGLQPTIEGDIADLDNTYDETHGYQYTDDAALA